jgi:hypothetical protein
MTRSALRPDGGCDSRARNALRPGLVEVRWKRALSPILVWRDRAGALHAPARRVTCRLPDLRANGWRRWIVGMLPNVSFAEGRREVVGRTVGSTSPLMLAILPDDAGNVFYGQDCHRPTSAGRGGVRSVDCTGAIPRNHLILFGKRYRTRSADFVSLPIVGGIDGGEE